MKKTTFREALQAIAGYMGMFTLLLVGGLHVL